MTGCSHCKSLAESKLQDTYRLAVRLALAISSDKLSFKGRCKKCPSSRVIACLHCDDIFCIVHGPLHDAQHHLGVCLWERSEGYLYCFTCKTFVVDDAIERLRLQEVRRALTPHYSTSTNGESKKHANGILLEKDAQNGDESALKKAKRPPHHASTGIRGLTNMGATCYMAVVLQTLVHNPFLKNHFLAGQHDHTLCLRQVCVECSLDRLFCDFFGSESVKEYSVPDLLVATASYIPSMCGATEQDAHEFLQFLLEQLHQSFLHSEKLAQNGKVPDESGPCACIAHRVFGGIIESSLECECGHRKKTDDPFLDLSLEVTGSQLGECLERFTSSESLSHYTCEKCNSAGKSARRILVKKLPLVLQIQLKRFNHNGVSSKLDTKVAFDLFLDMARYTVAGDKPIRYELFGVICHTGSLDTGHYTCMVKHSSGNWFRFDDAVMRPVSPLTVLDANAYLLFYAISSVI